jgi:hypothetical protein
MGQAVREADAVKINITEHVQGRLESILLELADRDDDEPIPLRAFLVERAASDGVALDGRGIQEWTTAGELRRRTRAALAMLARGACQ